MNGWEEMLLTDFVCSPLRCECAADAVPVLSTTRCLTNPCLTTCSHASTILPLPSLHPPRTRPALPVIWDGRGVSYRISSSSSSKGVQE